MVLFTLVIIGGAFAEPRNENYRVAMKAMKERRYDDAVQLFNQIVDAGDEDVDAALYWKAFSLHKTGKNSQALSALKDLEEEWPDSSWANDGEALKIEIQTAMGMTPDPDEHSDMDIKLVALAGLLHTEPEKAMDLLEKIINGNQSEELKERALFILVQKPDARGEKILQQLAKDSDSTELRRGAVMALSAGAFPNTNDFLVRLYREETNREFKEIPLDGLMARGATDTLVELAREEQDPEVLSMFVHHLGVLGKTDFLKELYNGDYPNELKEQVLQGLFLAKDEAFLLKVAEEETDPELLNGVFHSLALADGCDSLVRLYEDTDSVERKIAIIEAVFLDEKCSLLRDVVEKESNPELVSHAVRSLSLNGSRNQAYLRTLYGQADDVEVKRALAEAFFIMQDVDQLIVIAKDSSNMEVKKAAVQYLSLMKSKKAKDFLTDLINE